MRTGRRRRIAAYVALVAMLAAACTDTTDVDGEATEAPTQQARTVSTEAGELRIRLEEAFGLHAHLIAEADRASGAAGRASGDALEESATQVVTAVAEAADADDAATARLRRAWTSYVASVEAPEGRRSRRVKARASRRLATALSTMTDTLEQQGVERLLEEPLDKLARHAVAYEEREHEDAYGLEREAFADMVTLGGTVAAGIIEADPDRYPGPRSTGALELHSALRQLLGEHALLTVTTNRRGVVSARDFSAAAAAVNGNTADLSAALSSVFTGAVSFEAAWRDRISLLAEYAAAVGDGRDKVAQRTRVRVRRQARRIADVLEGLSGGEIADADSRELLRDLDAALLAQTQAFNAKRWDRAERTKTRAYGAALALADLIAAAAAAQQPDAFPTE